MPVIALAVVLLAGLALAHSPPGVAASQVPTPGTAPSPTSGGGAPTPGSPVVAPEGDADLTWAALVSAGGFAVAFALLAGRWLLTRERVRGPGPPGS